ncbi:hypothetical protein DFH07DRAFT_847608 [Mycena maculata]|uniref:Uncharacterized protein n=1 Tax=Mycena maculata TaxID=230809 RepID=A0AAD7I0C9_9AGAR|nr:hypothetical protein DFH07DRAFT_847608 [Mycena maculata]
MKFLVLSALLATPLASSAVPIPQIAAISPYVTQFTRRSAPPRIRGIVGGLVSRIPEVLHTKQAERDDIFLARALEDTVFASAQDVVARRQHMGRESENNGASDVAASNP